MAANPLENADVQALCWLLDAEVNLLAVLARPKALAGWLRERLREF
jgi:hypothetical protein